MSLSSALVRIAVLDYVYEKISGATGRHAIRIAFAFPPPLFARLNLIGTISSHHMINPLITAQSILLFRIFERGREAAGSRMAMVGIRSCGRAGGIHLLFLYYFSRLLCAVFLLFISSHFDCGVSSGLHSGALWVFLHGYSGQSFRIPAGSFCLDGDKYIHRLVELLCRISVLPFRIHWAIIIPRAPWDSFQSCFGCSFYSCMPV